LLLFPNQVQVNEMIFNEPRLLRNLALAVAIGGLAMACQEPNAVPAQNASTPSAPAAPASGPAAAPVSVGQVPKELSAEAVQVVLQPDTLCNLERIDNRLLGSSEPFTPADSHNMVITGWMGDESTKVLPQAPVLMIRQVGASRVWEIPLALTVSRDDVAKATSAAALKTSGFELKADLSVLPAGTYRMVLVHDRDGGRFACDNGRDLTMTQ
jgi:hypothetical protein